MSSIEGTTITPLMFLLLAIKMPIMVQTQILFLTSTQALAILSSTPIPPAAMRQPSERAILLKKMTNRSNTMQTDAPNLAKTVLSF